MADWIETQVTTKVSPRSVAATVARLTGILSAKDMKVFAVIDQSEEARGRAAEDHQRGFTQLLAGLAGLFALIDYGEDLHALSGQDSRQPRDGSGDRSRALVVI